MDLTLTYLDSNDVTVVEDTSDNLMYPTHAGVVRTLVDSNGAGVSATFLPWSRILTIESVDGAQMMAFN